MIANLRQLAALFLSISLAVPLYAEPASASNDIRNITDTYDYDAFGNLIHSTGSTPNNYLFAGEQFDSDLGLYFNRARYLNVSTGRFWSMDSFEGLHDQPLSLHKYLYAQASPVNRRDPSGKQDEIEEVAAEGIGEELDSNIAAGAEQQGAAATDLVGEAEADVAESAAPAEEGEAAEAAAENPLKVTDKGLKHILERHAPGGARTAGKSLFNAGEDIRGLLQAGENTNPVQQLGGNFQRVIDAGREIGIDRVTGAVTQVYTIITNAAGEVVTAFPGLPVP
ncbi:MAG TPA: RHS repeat-associated core domain-containing protein [Candidatus Acidoferrum sp.]